MLFIILWKKKKVMIDQIRYHPDDGYWSNRLKKWIDKWERNLEVSQSIYSDPGTGRYLYLLGIEDYLVGLDTNETSVKQAEKLCKEHKINECYFIRLYSEDKTKAYNVWIYADKRYIPNFYDKEITEVNIPLPQEINYSVQKLESPFGHNLCNEIVLLDFKRVNFFPHINTHIPKYRIEDFI